MKASTLFAITVSLLLGLGAVAGARYAGLFNKSELPPPAKEPPIRVLVAATNLFEDVTVTADQVTVVEIPPESPAYADLKKQQDRLLPPRPAAAALRLPKRNISADEPLYKSLFRDHELPLKITDRLEPGMRSVNVSVGKEHAAGGVIRTGEYVDVMLTSDVNYKGERFGDGLKTNCIARGCKVIMKRNSIWNAMGSDPDDKPLNFTLQANPYRASLIEFAANRGVISLLPTSTPPIVAGTFSDQNSKEYADEQARVDATNRGEYSVSMADLVRIFNLVPPAPVTPPPPPNVTRNIAGVDFVQSKVFSADGIQLGLAPPGTRAENLTGAGGAAGQAQGGGFSLTMPSGADGKGGCATCGSKK
jgi:Flp pilus assembly protein CpaB